MRSLVPIGALMVIVEACAAAGAANLRVEQIPDSNTVIHLDGPIVVGDAAKLAAVQATQVDVSLSSLGGDVVTAVKIGTMIHSRGWSTSVPANTTCASACGLIWVAGATRSISSDGKVGFHAAFRTTDRSESGSGNAIIGAYLSKLGMSYDTIVYLTSASPSRMTWIKPYDRYSRDLSYTFAAKATQGLKPEAEPTSKKSATAPQSIAIVAPRSPPAPSSPFPVPLTPMPPQTSVPDAEVIAPAPPPPRAVSRRPDLAQVAKLLEQMPDDQPARSAFAHAKPAPRVGLVEPTTQIGIISQRAGLLVDAPGDPQRVTTYAGSVVWRVDSVSAGQGQPLSNAVHADVEIPEAKLVVSMVIKKNFEPQFPASHTIEFHFTEQAGNTLGSVKQINVPELRREDADQTGIPLIGVPVSITDNHFLVGLSLGKAEQINAQLIADRNWFDVSILLASGTVAKVTFEKGSTRAKIVNDMVENSEKPAATLRPEILQTVKRTQPVAATSEPEEQTTAPVIPPPVRGPFPDPKKIKTFIVHIDGTMTPSANNAR